MTGPENGEALPQYDLLLMTVTPSEQTELLKAARDLGIPFEKRRGPRIEGKARFDHPFYHFGQLGAYRVAAIRSTMGALDYGGSAASALVYRSATRATGIIAVGMAFGISDTNQAIGDVLVSTGLFPYDDRDVVAFNDGWAYRYDDIDPATGLIREPDKSRRREPAEFRKAKESLVQFFRQRANSATGFKVYFGALLSGSARVHCRAYRDMLYKALSLRGQPIVGGEMEAVGLLSCSEPDAPWWIVVKGICDFGDEKRDAIIKTSRLDPCRNAARFVLTALRESTAEDNL